MSYPALDLAQDAATLIGEPAMTRITADIWRLALNRVQRDLAVRMDMYEREFTFDILAEHRYTYQTGSVRLRWLRFGTDSESDSYLFLKEMREDEWRSAIHGHYPRGEPTHYFARRNWFHLFPWPETVVDEGGVYAAWSLPPDITEINQQTSFPDLMRDYVVDGMLVTGLRALKQYEEADAHYRGWIARLDEIKGQVEDPSADRRPQFLPGAGQSPEQI